MHVVFVDSVKFNVCSAKRHALLQTWQKSTQHSPCNANRIKTKQLILTALPLIASFMLFRIEFESASLLPGGGAFWDCIAITAWVARTSCSAARQSKWENQVQYLFCSILLIGGNQHHRFTHTHTHTHTHTWWEGACGSLRLLFGRGRRGLRGLHSSVCVCVCVCVCCLYR